MIALKREALKIKRGLSNLLFFCLANYGLIILAIIMTMSLSVSFRGPLLLNNSTGLKLQLMCHLMTEMGPMGECNLVHLLEYFTEI